MKKLLMTMLALLILSNAAFAEQVFATKNGKKYHKQDCVFIKDRNASEVDDKDAVAKGLKPCGKCYKADEEKAKK